MALASGASSSKWEIQSTPNPFPSPPSPEDWAELDNIGCISATSCMAVGNYGTSTTVPPGPSPFAEWWDGSRWAATPMPNPTPYWGSKVGGISCPSKRTCIAVGTERVDLPDYSQPQSSTGFAERWNGRSWSVMATPNPLPRGDGGSSLRAAGLAGVDCPTSNECIAVGNYSNGDGHGFTFALRWDGLRWRVQRTPEPADGGMLGAVSCTSSTSCIAAGSTSWAVGDKPFVERWNGHRWNIQPLPNPAKGVLTTLDDISCASAKWCTVVGNYGINGRYVSLAERWNGKRWRVQATPHPGYQSYLGRVACASSEACTAVGFSNQSKSSDIGQPLVDRWNGHRWSVQATPVPEGASGAGVNGVACTSSTSCTAVGSYRSGSNSLTLAERWTG